MFPFHTKKLSQNKKTIESAKNCEIQSKIVQKLNIGIRLSKTKICSFVRNSIMKEVFLLEYTRHKDSASLPPDDIRLIEAAKKIRTSAYTPYSKFLVGCALLLEDGNIVCGNNQENAAFPSGLCAERVAFFSAKSQFPSKKILAAAIIGGKENQYQPPISPCGACRQVMLEYEILQQTPIRLLLVGLNDEVIEISSCTSLLPLSFDGKELSQ